LAVRQKRYAESEEEEVMIRILLVLGAMLVATTAFAQNTPPAAAPPAADDNKGPAQLKAAVAAAKGKSIAEKLQACLEVDDGTKYRLDCYDAAIPPKPNAKPPKPKGVMDCRFIKEEDERLACLNNFTGQIPKFSR
jgi:hypothetical protein